MDHRDRPYQRFQGIVDRIGIGGHLDYDRILESQVLPGPFFQGSHRVLWRAQHLVQTGVHTCGDEVSLVDVQTDETSWGRIKGQYVHTSCECSGETGPGAHLQGETSCTDTSLPYLIGIQVNGPEYHYVAQVPLRSTSVQRTRGIRIDKMK
jgi:hypothetical protein